MQVRFLALYCASGPFRHVRSLIRESHAEWLPWGYRMPTDAARALGVRAGDEMELWEIDDTRNASAAVPLTVARVDYVGVAEGYLSLTLKPCGLPAVADEAQVLAQAHRRRLIDHLELSLSGDGEPVQERASPGCERPVQDCAAFQTAFTVVPLGR